ncbi:hypothetical protein GCM10028807_10150 [Spirosoma daeguense]
MNRFYTSAILLILSLSAALAQQSWNLKPYSVQLPRVSTVQQITSTIVEPQPGSIVYNTDQQKVAIRNSTGWQYLDASGGTYQNRAYFTTNSLIQGSTTTPANPAQTWTIPIGVTKFEIEVWGGGAGGGTFTSTKASSNSYVCSDGGFAGGYARKTIQVVPSVTTVSINPGAGGKGADAVFVSANAGGDSFVTYNGQTLRASGGGLTSPRSGTDAISGQPALLIKGGSPGPFQITYGQRSSTEFIRTIQCSNGGIAYGTPPDQAGLGLVQVYRNSDNVRLYQLNERYSDQETPQNDGSFPGGGGGCGQQFTASLGGGGPLTFGYSGSGAPGLIIIYW